MSGSQSMDYWNNNDTDFNCKSQTCYISISSHHDLLIFMLEPPKEALSKLRASKNKMFNCRYMKVIKERLTININIFFFRIWTLIFWKCIT